MTTLPRGRLGRAAYRQLDLPRDYIPPPPDALARLVEDAARAAGVTVVGTASCRNNLGGATAAVAVAESQIVVTTIHTPNGWLATADVFFCGEFDPLETMEHLSAELGATGWSAPRCRGGFICRLDPTVIQKPLKLAAVDLYGCQVSQLNDVSTVERLMRRAAERAHLAVADSVFYRFQPYGVTGMVIGPAVVMTAHTWPEYGVACVDVESRDNGIYRQTMASIETDLSVVPDNVFAHQQLNGSGLTERGTQLHLMASPDAETSVLGCEADG